MERQVFLATEIAAKKLMEELLAVDGTEEADDKKDNGPVGDSEKIGKHMKTRCQESAVALPE